MAGLAGLLLELAACKPSPIRIGELRAHPERYERKQVAVVGRVRGPVDLVDRAGYEVGDSTGTIVVATQQSGVPLAGAPIGIAGEFRGSIRFEGTQITRMAILEARRWNPDPSYHVPAPPDSGEAAPKDSG